MIENLVRIVAALAVCAVLAAGCGEADSSEGAQDQSSATNPPASDPAEGEDPTDGDDSTGSDDSNEGDSPAERSDCSAPEGGGELLDQDFDDHQVPWQRNGADQVAIYFESGDVSEEYRQSMEQGATSWSRSPCLDVRVVERCPDGVNCITVSLTEGDDADGNFASVEEGDFTVGGHIDLYVQPLDALGDGAKLNVTVHEMGHAVGLRHRLTERVLMNGATYTDIFEPDDTDYHNLLVLYGNQP